MSADVKIDGNLDPSLRDTGEDEDDREWPDDADDRDWRGRDKE